MAGLVVISNIAEVNQSVLVLRLHIADVATGITFIPGQWLRFHDGGIFGPGRYAILSDPRAADATAPGSQPYVEVALRTGPSFPPQGTLGDLLLGSKFRISVGGSYVWEPTGRNSKNIRTCVFIAGGMGLSPLVSIISSMHNTGPMPEEIYFLFACSVAGDYDISNVLGLGKLLEISEARPGQFHLDLFFCGHPSRALMEKAVPRRGFEPRQVLDSDVLSAFGNVQSKESSVCYISAPQQMTDHFEQLVRVQVGLEDGQVRVNSVPDDSAHTPLWGDGSGRVFS